MPGVATLLLNVSFLLWIPTVVQCSLTQIRWFCVMHPHLGFLGHNLFLLSLMKRKQRLVMVKLQSQRYYYTRHELYLLWLA